MGELNYPQTHTIVLFHPKGTLCPPVPVGMNHPVSCREEPIASPTFSPRRGTRNPGRHQIPGHHNCTVLCMSSSLMGEDPGSGSSEGTPWLGQWWDTHTPLLHQLEPMHSCTAAQRQTAQVPAQRTSPSWEDTRGKSQAPLIFHSPALQDSTELLSRGAEWWQ